MLAVSLALLPIVRVGRLQGLKQVLEKCLKLGFKFKKKNKTFNQPDDVLVMLMPIGILNAEQMPNWFVVNTRRGLSKIKSIEINLKFNSNDKEVKQLEYL